MTLNAKECGLVKDLKGVASVFFDDRDIVRHPLVSKIVKAFDAED